MKREQMTIRALYDTEKTMAGAYLAEYTYPWEVLSHIGEIIKKIGENLSEDEYDKRGQTSGFIKQPPFRRWLL